MLLPLSPCGRGWRDANAVSSATGERSLSADADPSSGTDFVRATFSHKGRREKAQRRVNLRSADSTAARSPETAATPRSARHAICGFEGFRSQSKEKNVCRKHRTPSNDLPHCHPVVATKLSNQNSSHSGCGSCESDKMERHICSIAGPW